MQGSWGGLGEPDIIKNQVGPIRVEKSHLINKVASVHAECQ